MSAATETVPTSSTVKRVCFTLNNYTQEEYDALVAYITKNAKFGVIGREVSGTETPHLQGFFNLKSPRKWSTLKNVNKRMHMEAARGTDEDNLKYCTKEDLAPFIFGQVSTQGQRTDLDILKDAIKAGMSKMELMEQFSHTYSAHQSFVAEYTNELANSRLPKQEIEAFRPWQQEIVDIVDGPADNRHIIWVYDPVGGIGKTHLARWLVDHRNAFYTNGGRSIDVVYAYNRQPIVIFDFVRETQDFVSYSTIEQMKNGILSSNKYQSCMKRFPSPHILVFANFEPAVGKFSADRIILKEPTMESACDFIAF